MKTLIAVTCVAVLAAVGHYFWTAAQPAAAQVANRQATDQLRERCEKDYKFLMDQSRAPIAGTGGRYLAMMFADCEEFGAFSSRQIRNIENSEVGDLWAAYKADPTVWDVD